MGFFKIISHAPFFYSSVTHLSLRRVRAVQGCVTRSSAFSSAEASRFQLRNSARTSCLQSRSLTNQVLRQWLSSMRFCARASSSSAATSAAAFAKFSCPSSSSGLLFSSTSTNPPFQNQTVSPSRPPPSESPPSPSPPPPPSASYNPSNFSPQPAP